MLSKVTDERSQEYTGANTDKRTHGLLYKECRTHGRAHGRTQGRTEGRKDARTQGPIEDKEEIT